MSVGRGVMTDFLEEVSLRTRQRIQTEKNPMTLGKIKDRVASAAPAKPFGKSIRKAHGIGLIAELKQASPSAGVIRKETDFVKRIDGYTQGGASAISILTEPHYFNGSTQILELARRETALPLLRKDFIIDPFQIDESRAIGADAILLIVALLEESKLRDFMAHCQGTGLDVLVEIHDERELETALNVGSTIIGINNRNLKTLKVDLATAQRLVPRIPKDETHTIVIESGIQNPSQLKEFKSWGAHAILVGEALMRHDNAQAAVHSFVEADQND